MKRLVLTFVFSLFISLSMGQVSKSDFEQESTKTTIINFLKWYGEEQSKPTKIVDTLESHRSILVWNEIDTLIKPSVGMLAVEHYLNWLKSSGSISETFINDLRQYFQKIADELKTVNSSPKTEGIYAIPGLNYDVVFKSFEPEEFLLRYNLGVFKKISIVKDKAIVQFYVPPSKNYVYTNMLFTLTKENETWLIDYIGYYD